MTREEFIKELDEKGYSYEIEGDKIVVTHKGYVYLESLTSLPPGVQFNNKRGVNLKSLKILQPGVVFKNKGSVYLNSLKSLPHGVEFKNKGSVGLESLTGGRFVDWKGNIEGIGSTRLLNLMIKQGILER